MSNFLEALEKMAPDRAKFYDTKPKPVRCTHEGCNAMVEAQDPFRLGRWVTVGVCEEHAGHTLHSADIIDMEQGRVDVIRSKVEKALVDGKVVGRRTWERTLALEIKAKDLPDNLQLMLAQAGHPAPEMPWSWLWGVRGTGKTSAVIMFITLWAARRAKQLGHVPSIRYMSEAKLLSLIGGFDEPMHIKVGRMAEVELLVIDEAGRRGAHGGNDAAWYELMDQRYQEGKRTVFVSNRHPDDLTAPEGGAEPHRLYDGMLEERISEMTGVYGQVNAMTKIWRA